MDFQSHICVTTGGVFIIMTLASGYFQALLTMAISTFLLLRSVLQSPLEKQLEGPLLSSLPKGPNEEVNDGIGTAVNTAQSNCHWMKITKSVKRNWKPA
jgi:hypothetical protein